MLLETAALLLSRQASTLVLSAVEQGGTSITQGESHQRHRAAHLQHGLVLLPQGVEGLCLCSLATVPGGCQEASWSAGGRGTAVGLLPLRCSPPGQDAVQVPAGRQPT